MVDAAYPLPGTSQVYIWSGRQYARIEFTPGGSEERLKAGPKSIRTGWKTFDESDFGRVDTVVSVPGSQDQVYVFFGGRYLKIKIDSYFNDTFVNNGPRTIPAGWKSLERAGFDTVDAAVRVPGTNNQLYFFRGLNYVRVDNSTDEIINGPSPISQGWPSITQAGFDAVDAILPSPTGGDVYYVFRGDKYAKIKVDNSRNDTLFSATKLISSGWTTLDGWV